MIYLTDNMNLTKRKGSSMDTSIPFRRGNKIIMRSKGKNLDRREDREGQGEEKIGSEGRLERVLEDQENE